MTMTEEVSPKEMLEYAKAELEEFLNNVTVTVNRRIEIIDKYLKMLDMEGEKEVKKVEEVFKPERKDLKGPITEKQMKFLRDLYKQLGREVPDGIEGWSKATASAVIDELLKIKNQGKR